MAIERNRRNKRDMATALAVLGASSMLAPGALAQAAGSAGGVGTQDAARGGTQTSEVQAGRIHATTPLDSAQSLYNEGRLIEAKFSLDRLIRSRQMDALSPAQRSKALSLVKDIEGAIRTADPIEVSLQKAELGVAEGDLLLAERQATGVSGTSFASASQKTRAEKVLRTVSARREDIAPLAPGLMEQSLRDFDAKKYAEAKSGILTLLRSGVKIDGPSASRLESYQLQILEIERQRGEAFDVQTVAGLGVKADEEPDQPALPDVPTQKEAGQKEAAKQAASGAATSPTQPSDPANEYPDSLKRASPAPAEPLREPAAASASDVPPNGPDFGPGTHPDQGGRPRNPFGQNQRQPEPMPEPSQEPMAAPDPQPVQEPMPAVAPVASPQPSGQNDVIALAMRAEGQRLIAEADQAFDQARYSLASEKYSAALAQFRSYLSPADIDRAEKRLAESNQRLGAGSGGDGIAQAYNQNIQLQQQQARAQFQNEVDQAKQRLAAGDAGKAQELAARARLSITNARGAFSDSEYEGYIKQLDDLNREIETRREALAKEAAAKREIDLKDKAQKAEANRITDRDRKVSEAIDRVRALQADRKYGEALQVIEQQALFLEPNNPTALLLRDILRDLDVYSRFKNYQEAKQWGHVNQSLDNEDAMVPPIGFMDYPKDWPAKTFQRGEIGAFADTVENRRVLAKMTDPAAKTAVALTDNRFEDVLKFLAGTSNLPIDADWDALATVGVERDTPVTVKLPAVTLETAINKILGKVSKDQFARAGWAVTDGIITISSDEQLRKNRTLVIYNIQDLIFEIPNYPDVPQIDLTSVLQQGQGGNGQSPFTGNTQQQNRTPDQVRQERERRTRQITDIIQQNVDFDGWKDNGGETGAIQELNGSLIITNTPRNHREIIGLLSKLREIRNMQINVETKFLLVNQNWFEQIGFDLDIVFNPDSRQVQQARITQPNVQPRDFFNFGGPFGSSTSPRGVTRTVTSPNAAGTNVTNGVVNPDSWSPIGTIQDSIGLTSSLAEGDFAQSVLRQAPALGIAGQFLDDIQVDFLIQATQADKRTVQLTAPRLTFTNGQTSNIFVVTQQAFVSDLQPITGDSAVGFDPTVSVASEGVTMLVEGVVSSDRRYVTMNIDAGVARIDGFSQQGVTAVAGGQLVNSASTQSFIQLPTVTVTRVRTTATVPDEGTLLIGGQRLITEVEVETGVPVLSKIPIINRFFTNRLESKEEQTLLVLLKPTILIQTEEEEKAFPGLLESVRSGVPLR